MGQKNGGNPLGTFLLFIPFCLIPMPGNPDAAAVVMATTVGQTPKIQPGNSGPKTLGRIPIEFFFLSLNPPTA